MADCAAVLFEVALVAVLSTTTAIEPSGFR
jgi:hypothetical protein